MTNAALRGKPDAGNPHVRFDEGEVASAATPRRGSLLYNMKRTKNVAMATMIGLSVLGWRTASADTWTNENGVVWRYTISNGAASVGGGSFRIPAIPRSTQGDIVIPATLGGCPVTTIAQCAFQDCKSITSLEIPDSVTTIKQSAFAYCVSLRRLRFGSGISAINYSDYGSQANFATFYDADGSYYQNYTTFYNPFTGCSSLVGIEFGTNTLSVLKLSNFRAATGLGYMYFRGALPASITAEGTRTPTMPGMSGRACYVSRYAYPDGLPMTTWAGVPLRYLDGKLPSDAEPYDLTFVPPQSGKGLVAYYRFDGDVKDSSGYGNDGVVHGISLTKDRHGSDNSACYFDGASYIEVPNSSSLNGVVKTVTCSVWVKPESWDSIIGEWMTFVCKGTVIPRNIDFTVWRNNGLEMVSLESYLALPKFPTLGEWQMLTYTSDGSTVKYYVNGICIASGNGSIEAKANSDPLLIGMDPPGSLEYFKGTMDELRIYNRALSEEEVYELYAFGEEGGAVVQLQSPDSNGISKTTILRGDSVYLSYGFKEAWTINAIADSCVNRVMLVREPSGGIVGTTDDIVDSVTVGQSVYRTGLELPILQDLDCGSYRAMLVLNADRTLGETDYVNNTNTVAFTVVPSVEITFASEGNTVATRKYGVGDPYGRFPDSPIRTGFRFVGWFTDEDGGDMVTATSVVSDSPTTLYAHWDVAIQQTVTVGGTLASGETKWMCGNLYKVTSNLTIPSGATLTLEPGVIVKFEAGKSMTVNSGGILKAIGTRALPIVFTSIKDDVNGGDTNGDEDATQPQAGDWARLLVRGNATMDYCSLLYGSLGSGTDDILTVDGGTVRFSNGKVMNIGKYAVGVESGHFYMNNSVIAEAYCAFRHWPSDPIINSVIYNCNRLSNNNGQKLYNCIIVGVNEAWDWSSGRGNTYKNCVFWNESGFGLQKLPGSATTANGNVWANPLFVDPENGDFRIAANSPCVDAGDGTVAPEKDYYGLERRDVGKVTDGGVPSANGNCPDIGIHEVLWDEDESPYDIAPTAVSIDKTTAKIGDKVKISWTIQNLGTEDVVGGWHDAVSLVSSSGQSVELGEVLTTYTLKRKMSMNVNGTFMIPALPEGTWYARVNTNSRRSDVPEGLNTTNNVLSSTQGLAVSLAATPYADGASGTLSVGSSTVVKFTFPAGTTGQIARVSVPAGLSVSYGLGFMPQGAYASGTMTATEKGEAMFHVPAGTTEVYLVMDAAQGEGQNYSVSFEKGDLAILSVSPNTVPSSGTTSITISGAGLDNDCAVVLVDSVSGHIPLDSPQKDAFGNLVAMVDCSTLDAGRTYAVRVERGDSVVELLSSVTVSAVTGKGKLEFNLIVPQSMRQGRQYLCRVDYRNTGNVDVDIPFFIINGTEGMLVRLENDNRGWRDEMWILGIGNDSRAIHAGESGTLFFLCRTERTGGEIKCAVLDESKSLDLNSMAANFGVDVDNVQKFGRLRGFCGDTWGILAKNARTWLARCSIGGGFYQDVANILRDVVSNGSTVNLIDGFALDAVAGTFMPDVVVSLVIETENGEEEVGQTVTDASGYFVFLTSRNGTYRIKARNCLSEDGLIDVNAMSETYNVNIKVKKGYKAWVKIPMQSLAISKTNEVVAVNVDAGISKRVVVNNDGECIFTDLIPGEWRFSLQIDELNSVVTNTEVNSTDCIVTMPRVEMTKINIDLPSEYLSEEGRYVFTNLVTGTEFECDKSGHAIMDVFVGQKLFLVSGEFFTNIVVSANVIESFVQSVDAQNVLKLPRSATMLKEEKGGLYLWEQEDWGRTLVWGMYWKLSAQTEVAAAFLDNYLGEFGVNKKADVKHVEKNDPWIIYDDGYARTKTINHSGRRYVVSYPDIRADLECELEANVARLRTGEVFYPGTKLDFNTSDRKGTVDKLSLAFGGMETGHLEIDLCFITCISPKQTLYQVWTTYISPDRYDFESRDKCVKMADLPWIGWTFGPNDVFYPYDLEQAGWATPFYTELRISDYFEFVIDDETGAPPEGQVCVMPKVPQSEDPNEMVGPVGTGEARYVQPGEWMTYTIYFENKTNATAAAQEVYVTNPLSEWLDWSTFEMGEVSFNNQIDIGLSGLNGGASEVQMNGTNYAVRTVLGGGNDGEGVITTSGVAHWYMRIVDNSDETTWPADPYAGFLPPNDPETHCGEGHLTYRIKVRDDAPRNVVITNSATIVFDYNAPIETDPSWWNTVGTFHDVSLEIDGVTTNLTLIAGEAFGELPTPKTARTGYTFDGWYTGENGTGIKATSDTIVPEGEFSLYQNWIANGYIVRFNANGGAGTMADQAFVYDTPGTLSPNEFTRTYHDFTGWATNATGVLVYADGSVVTNLTAVDGGVVELFAAWERQKVSVVIGEGDDAITAQLEVGLPYGDNMPTNPAARTGWTFGGWFTGPNGTGRRVTAESIVEPGDSGLYAKWSANAYKVRFDANGGTGTMADQAFRYGTAQKLSSNAFTRKMYAFAGWARSADGAVEFADGQSVKNLATAADGVVTLYAVWTMVRPMLWNEVTGDTYVSMASVYNGYLYDGDGNVKGTILVKVGKQNAKTKLSTVKATVTLSDGKSKNLKAIDKGKAVIAPEGTTDVPLTGGDSCTVTLGLFGMSGHYGSLYIDGSRDYFSSRSKSALSTASAMASKWAAVNVAWDDGTMTVTIDKKGKAKIVGNLSSGTKVSSKSQLIIGENWCCVPVIWAKKKEAVAVTLWLPISGDAAMVSGLDGDVNVGAPGVLNAGAEFRIDADELCGLFGDSKYAEYLPDGVSVEQKGTKWIVAGGAKTGKVQVGKDGKVDEVKAGANPSALKFTYRVKGGIFNGSFKAYMSVNGKPKALTVNVTGVLIDGKGYGTATIKRMGSVAVTIE